MGNLASTLLESEHTDGISVLSKRSFKVEIGQKMQVLMMAMILPALTFTVTLSVMSEFSEGNPFIGLVTTKKSPNDICIPNDLDLIMWSLKDRTIYWGGKEYHKTHIVCSSDSIIAINWNTERREVKLWVKAASGEVQTENIPVKGLDSDKLWPVFGATTVGNFEPVQFELLKSVGESSDLHDVTRSTRFTSAGGQISVSGDGRQLHRSNKDKGNGVALISRVLTRGKHRWKLLVVRDFGASIGIGLATSDFKLSEKYLQDSQRHIYHHRGLYLWRSYRGHLYSHGRQLPLSLEPLGCHRGQPVEVEFFLDLGEGTLEVFKNGKSLGVAFRDIQGPVQPAIAFYAGYQKEVHLIDFWSSDEGTSVDVVEPDRATVEPDRVILKAHIGKMVFDPKSVRGKLLLSEDGLTITREREHLGNALCLLDVSLTSGVHRWSFVVQNDQGASICIGVAREPITLPETGNLYLSPELYVLRSFQGILYAGGREVKKGLSEFWLGGSLVEVSVEVLPRKGAFVRFSVNGEDQGIAFSGIAPPIRPVVGFYAGMQKKITLIHYEHSYPDLSTSSKPDVNIADTEKTNYSSKVHPMPLFLNPSKISMYYTNCMVCGSQVDTVALPCKHAYMCAEHLEVGQHCLICDETVIDTWNILLL